MNNNLTLAPNPAVPEKKRHICRRNKSAGDSFELQVIRKLKLIGFPHAVTTRAENPKRDDQKVDIMNAEEYKNGRMPFNFQCKNMSTNTIKHGIQYPKILAEMPKGEEMNVLLHNQTVKHGTRFLTKGQFAIMQMDQFLEFVQKYNQLDEAFALLNAYFDYIPDDQKTELSEKLASLGQK